MAGRISRPTSSSSAPASPGPSSRRNSLPEGLKVAILEAGQRSRSGNSCPDLLGCGDQGSRMSLPAYPAGDAPDLERPAFLVRAGRARPLRQHLPQGGRRYHLALARHLPPLRPERLPAEDALRTGRRLAALLRGARAFLRARRGGDRRVRRRERRPRRAPQRRLPNARHSADLSRQDLRSSPGGERVPGAIDPAGPAVAGSVRPARLLRQCELHPGLPGAGQVRRHDPPGSRDRRGSDPVPGDHGRLRRDRRRPPGHRHSLQASRRKRRPRVLARSTSLPHTRSRRRACS